LKFIAKDKAIALSTISKNLRPCVEQENCEWNHIIEVNRSTSIKNLNVGLAAHSEMTDFGKTANGTDSLEK
jgi:hypothetical protein